MKIKTALSLLGVISLGLATIAGAQAADVTPEKAVAAAEEQ